MKKMKALLVLLMIVLMEFGFNATVYATIETTFGRKGTAAGYRWKVDAGDIVPADDSTYDIGETGKEVKSIYVDTLILGGDSITGASQVSSPIEDQGTYVRIVGDDDIKLYDNGNITITGDMTADMYVMENGGTWDNATNNTITLLENSDTLSIAFDGTDIALDATAGLTVKLTNATDGTFDVYTNNVSTDYLQFSQGTNQSTITATGTGNDLYLAAAGGDINLADETVTGTGNLSIGGITCTSITGVDTITGLTNSDVLSFATDDTLAFSSDNGDNATVIQIVGYSGNDARLKLSADAAEDDGDEWFIDVDETDNNLGFWNETTEVFNISSAGNIDMLAGTVLTFNNDEYLQANTDDTIRLASNDESVVLELYSPNTSDGDAAVILHGDAGADVCDRWKILNDSSASSILFQTDSAVAGTYVTAMTLEGTASLLTVAGDITVSGNDIQLGSATTGVKLTSDGDGAITFLGTSSGSDEDLTINLDDTSNEITFSTSTSATLVDLDGALDLEISGNDLIIGETGVQITSDTDGAITLLGLSAGYDEDLKLNFDDTENEVSISSSTGVTLIDIEGAIDLQVSGGDYTMTSATASKPTINLNSTVVGATSSITTYAHTRGGVDAVDGDDIHTDIYQSYDDGTPTTNDYVTILYEVTDSAVGAEDGNVTMSVSTAGTSSNFLELDGIDGIDINAGAVDIDVAIAGNDQADLLVVDAGNNDVTITRNLAAGATSDSAMLTIAQSSATADNGCVSITNAAGATATDATVTIQSSAAGVVKSSLFVNHDGTAGATTEAAVVIDSQDVNTSALYIMSPVTAAGTTSQIDDYALAVVAEGVGGGASVYRNVSAATEALLNVREIHVDTTAPLVNLATAADASADDDAVTIATSSTAFDQRALFINHDCTAGTTTVPAVEIDSQMTTAAAMIIRSPVTAAGTSATEDDAALCVVAEGVGGAAYLSRNLASATEPILTVADAHVDSTGPAALFSYAADATGDDYAVTMQTTAATNDVGVLSLINAGVGSSLFVDQNIAAGVTTAAAVVIDSQDVKTAALYIMSPVDATGTTAQIDDYAVTVVAEGIGGGESIYRNVTGATTALLKLEEVHADSSAELLTIASAADDTTDNDLVTITASATAFNDRVLFINDDATAGATTVPAMEIDSERATAASLIVRGLQTEAGTSVQEDEAALVAVAGGVGGAAFFHRNVASATKAVVTIHDDHVDSTGPTLYVLSDQDATGDDSIMKIETTSTACDTAALEITQLGTVALLLTDGGFVTSVEDLTCSADDPGVATATMTTVVSTIVTDATGAAADEVTVGDGTKGQIKIFTLKTDGETTGCEIKPTNFANGTQVLLEDVGDSVMLIFDGTNWVLIGNIGGTIS